MACTSAIAAEVRDHGRIRSGGSSVEAADQVPRNIKAMEHAAPQSPSAESGSSRSVAGQLLEQRLGAIGQVVRRTSASHQFLNSGASASLAGDARPCPASSLIADLRTPRPDGTTPPVATIGVRRTETINDGGAAGSTTTGRMSVAGVHLVEPEPHRHRLDHVSLQGRRPDHGKP